MSLVGEVVLVVGVGRGHDRIASLDAKEQWGGGLLLSSGLFAQSSITMGGGAVRASDFMTLLDSRLRCQVCEFGVNKGFAQPQLCSDHVWHPTITHIPTTCVGDSFGLLGQTRKVCFTNSATKVCLFPEGPK